METTPALLDPGLGVVLVEFEYQYEGRDGSMVRIHPNERYELLMKTTSHWWQVRTGPGSKPFYVPAKYVRQLPHVPALCPALCPDTTPPNTSPAPTPQPVPVSVPVLPKEEPRKPSDQVVIRLRADGGHRRSENRMSTFGVPLDSEVAAAMARTTNGSGTTNMTDSLWAQGDSGMYPVTLRQQPIPVETPRAPPTLTTPQETESEPRSLSQGEGPQSLMTSEQDGAESEELPEEPSESEEEEPGAHLRTPDPEEVEESLNSSHIYESIQDLNIDLDALIGRDPATRQEVESEAPPPAQDSSSSSSSSMTRSKPESPIYANVTKHMVIPPPPADPAPPPPVPAHSVSGSSSSGLSPASPLSPTDEWQTHTDSDSGKLFYFNPLTRRSTWTPPLVPSPAPSQGGQWERLVDEVSGRFYFFNPLTGATSWSLPEPHPSSSSSTCPPLPEEDYLQDQETTATDDSVFTATSPAPVSSTHLDPRPDPGPGLSERSFPVRRHVSDLTDSSKGHAPDGIQGHLLEKAGIINKTKVCDNGKKIRKSWSQSWTVLHGGILTFHRDPKSAPSGAAGKASQIVPEYTVDLRGASVSWANNKSSKKNVLELKTRQGCEYLIQYDTESIINDWFKVISDAITQLDGEGSEDSDDSDRDENKSKRSSSRGSSRDSEQRRVRHKLRRFLQRRPTLQSVKERGYIRDAVFGCHLDTLCHRENSLVPRFVQKCVRFVERRGLDTDGIYRVSGNLAVIQRLRHRADHEEDLDLEAGLEAGLWTEVHVVTGALKLFFRELPEPLFPFSVYHKFIAAIQLPEYSQRLSYMKDLVQTLPLPNHSTMELLFRHLQRVIEHKEQNRMSVQSLAIVFGPTLLRPQEESNITVHMVFQSRIVELILQEVSTVFPPPK